MKYFNFFYKLLLLIILTIIMSIYFAPKELLLNKGLILLKEKYDLSVIYDKLETNNINEYSLINTNIYLGDLQIVSMSQISLKLNRINSLKVNNINVKIEENLPSVFRGISEIDITHDWSYIGDLKVKTNKDTFKYLIKNNVVSSSNKKAEKYLNNIISRLDK